LLKKRNKAGRIFLNDVLYTIEDQDYDFSTHLITDLGQGHQLLTNIDKDYDMIDELCKHLFSSYYCGACLAMDREEDANKEIEEVEEIQKQYYDYRLKLISKCLFNGQFMGLCKIIEKYLEIN
jgi:hypothetical protein